MGAAKTDIPSDKLMLELFKNTADGAAAGRIPDLVRRPDQHQAVPVEELGVQLHPDPVGDRQGAPRPSGPRRLRSQRQDRRLSADTPRQSGARSTSRGRARRRIGVACCSIACSRTGCRSARAPIRSIVEPHFNEYVRLLDVAPSEVEQLRRDFIETWPFAPHLLRLLEDQVLVATSAQETRDLISILADLFKARGEDAAILTAADFRLDDDNTGIGALLDSVSNQHHAQPARKGASKHHVGDRGDCQSQHGGSPPRRDHGFAVASFDCGRKRCRRRAVDAAGRHHARASRSTTTPSRSSWAPSSRTASTSTRKASRLVFKEEENPQAKLMACARNDKLFTDGSDQAQLAKEIRYVIGGTDDVAKAFRVIALPQAWITDPWSTLDAAEQPDQWDERLPVSCCRRSRTSSISALGAGSRITCRSAATRSASCSRGRSRRMPSWIATSSSLARAEMKAQEWKARAPSTGSSNGSTKDELRDILKKRFDRFAVLHRWNFADTDSVRSSASRASKHKDAQIPEGDRGALKRRSVRPRGF